MSTEGLRLHYVVAGEDIVTIARKWYDDWRGWRDIWDANKEHLVSPNQVFIGQVLAIPYRHHKAY